MSKIKNKINILYLIILFVIIYITSNLFLYRFHMLNFIFLCPSMIFLVYITVLFKRMKASFLLPVVMILNIVFLLYGLIFQNFYDFFDIHTIIKIVFIIVYSLMGIEFVNGVKQRKFVFFLLLLAVMCNLAVFIMSIIRLKQVNVDSLQAYLNSFIATDFFWDLALLIFAYKCHIPNLLIKRTTKDKEQIKNEKIKQRMKALKNNYDSGIINEKDFIMYGQELINEYNNNLQS